MFRRLEFLSLAISRPQILKTRTSSYNLHDWCFSDRMLIHGLSIIYITFHFNIYHHHGNHFIEPEACLHWLRLRIISLLSPALFPKEYDVRNLKNRFRTPTGSPITEESSSASRLFRLHKKENERCIHTAVFLCFRSTNKYPNKDQNLKKATLILFPWK